MGLQHDQGTRLAGSAGSTGPEPGPHNAEVADAPNPTIAPQTRGLGGPLRGSERRRDRIARALADEEPLLRTALRALFLTLCVLADGIGLPSVLLAFHASPFLVMFGTLFVLLVAAEVVLYRTWFVPRDVPDEIPGP
ncbi:MAG: hypothetical protein ACYDDF_00655 [Thermoplasmatota archaeon]